MAFDISLSVAEHSVRSRRPSGNSYMPKSIGDSTTSLRWRLSELCSLVCCQQQQSQAHILFEGQEVLTGSSAQSADVNSVRTSSFTILNSEAR